MSALCYKITIFCVHSDAEGSGTQEKLTIFFCACKVKTRKIYIIYI